MRRRFRAELLAGLGVVWPVLSVLLLLMAALGAAVAMIEGWKVTEGLYFAFVTGMTIGYGDFAPKEPLARVLAVAIGMTGLLLGGLIVAVGVSALQTATRAHSSSRKDQ
jgi:hypothetical protein